MDKYKFTGRRKVIDSVEYYQICANRDIRGENNKYFIRRGSIGGWLCPHAADRNLDQRDECWVGPNTILGEKTSLSGWVYIDFDESADDEYIIEDSSFAGNVIVHGKYYMYGVKIISSTMVSIEGTGFIKNTSIVGPHVCIKNAKNIRIERSRILGSICLSGSASICGSHIDSHASVSQNATIENACVSGNAEISGMACILGDTNAEHTYNIQIEGNTKIAGNACLKNATDKVFVFSRGTELAGNSYTTIFNEFGETPKPHRKIYILDMVEKGSKNILLK